MTFTGTLIEDLMTTVERAEQQAQPEQQVRPEQQVQQGRQVRPVQPA